MARKTPKTKRIKTKTGYRYMVDGKFATKEAYDKARKPRAGRVAVVKGGARKKPSKKKKSAPKPAWKKKRIKVAVRPGSKRTPTTVEAKVLGNWAIHKELNASGTEWSGRKSILTHAPSGLKAAGGHRVGDLRNLVESFPPELLNATKTQLDLRKPLGAKLRQLLRKLKDGDFRSNPSDPQKCMIANPGRKAKPRKRAKARKNPACGMKENPTSALSLQVARQIRDHLQTRGYTEVTGPKKSGNRYEVSTAVDFKGKKAVAIIGVSQIGDRIEVTISKFSSFGETLIDQTKYDTQRAFGSMVSSTLSKHGMRPYSPAPKRTKKTKPRKKSGVFAGFFKNPADMKKAWGKVRKVFIEERQAMAKNFPALVATGLVADQSVHDSERHYAMTGKTAKNKAEVRVAPALGLLPKAAIRGVIRHELGHAANMLGYKPPRAMKGSSYYVIERNADKAAEALSGAKIYYDKQGIERSGPGASGTRPRPKGLR